MPRVLRRIRWDHLAPTKRPAQEGALLGAIKNTGEDMPEQPLTAAEHEIEVLFAFKGERLARRLNNAINDMTTDERSRSEILNAITAAVPIVRSTVSQILNGSIQRPPDEVLRGFASVITGVSLSQLQELADADAAGRESDVDRIRGNASLTDSQSASLTTKRMEVLQHTTEVLRAFTGLTSAQKAHYETLADDTAREEFLLSADKSALIEEAQVTKNRQDVVTGPTGAGQDDPVIYQSANYTIRKSDGAKAAQLAEEQDTLKAEFAEMKAKSVRAALETQVKTNFPHIPATLDDLVDLLGLFGDMQDAEKTDRMMTMLKTMNGVMREYASGLLGEAGADTEIETAIAADIQKAQSEKSGLSNHEIALASMERQGIFGTPRH